MNYYCDCGCIWNPDSFDACPKCQGDMDGGWKGVASPYCVACGCDAPQLVNGVCERCINEDQPQEDEQK